MNENYRDIIFEISDYGITILCKYRYLHPLKGACQLKTLHHRKKDLFFLQGHHPVRDLSLVVACIRVFKIYWYGFLFDLLPCTHQDQGHTRKVKVAVASRRDFHCLGAKQLPYFSNDPWSGKRTPEKHRYLVMSNRL